MRLTSKAYDVLNVIVQIILPSLGTLYFALAGIWGFPNPEKVVGSIIAFDAFLGFIQAWFKKNWKPEAHGTVLVDDSDPDGTALRFRLNAPLEEIKPGKKFLVNVEDAKVPIA